ncbi:hypothetical protein [Bartonella sp. WD12.1]|uniref:hypothetical protein n=1 Tax=Bartonella sp. WD12.1 TaxID=1933903 RepID=UPI0009990665|nr:hypothetical protein [Bartonella sp. WD12.1]OPB29547.1 hypothetical protein BWD121_005670 [Bartonella sp. WD12.1]
MKAKEMLKEIYTRFYRLINRNKRIENASILIEEYTGIIPPENSTDDELEKQYSIQESVRLLKENVPSLKEMLHKSKVESCLKRYEETLEEEGQLIQEEQTTLENLSNLIEQKNKALQKQKKKLALKIKLFDILNGQNNAEANVKQLTKSVEFSSSQKVIPFEQKECLQA